MRSQDDKCMDFSSGLCAAQIKVKAHVTIGTCLHLRKQNMQRATRKKDFPWVNMPRCRCETEFAVDFPSLEVGSFTGSCRKGSEENGFIYEPVKSYANRSEHTCVNICSARADVPCSYYKKRERTKDSQSDFYWVWSTCNMLVSSLVLSLLDQRPHVHDSTFIVCVWLIFHLCHDSVDVLKPYWH